MSRRGDVRLLRIQCRRHGQVPVVTVLCPACSRAVSALHPRQRCRCGAVVVQGQGKRLCPFCYHRRGVLGRWVGWN